MNKGGRGNTLLVELLIVVLFFMLASTTLMEIFGAAKQNSNRATACNEAMMLGQNVAEQLYAADDVAAQLKELGFAEADGAWQLTGNGYTLWVDVKEEPTAAGILRDVTLTAASGGDTLMTLPASRYIPGEVLE